MATTDLPDALVSTGVLTVYSPLSRPPTFIGLELVYLACAALTFAHAWREYRRGDGAPLFTWLCVLVYGVVIEILSYHFVDNFWHGQFTVMLYHRKLPLYVTALYPVFIYTAIATVGRLRLGRLAEPFAVGLMIVVMDFPFDVIGPDAGFWTWSYTDPIVSAKWLGVPVTSYYWHLAFGGVMAALTRAMRPRVADLGRGEGRSAERFWKLGLTVPVALATLVLGFLTFLPFHGLKAVGVPEGLIVGALIASAAGISLYARRDPKPGRDELLAWIPAIFYPFHLLLAVMLWGFGGGPHALAKLAFVGAGLLVALVTNIAMHRGRPAVEGATAHA